MTALSDLVQARLPAIGAQFGIVPDDIVPLAGGEANRAWLLGPRLVLRVARDEGQPANDLRKEAIVIPAARAAGVRTPAIVAFDDTAALLPTPFMVLERCPGVDLAHQNYGNREPFHPAVMTEAGRQLARVHRITLGATEWSNAVPVDHGDDDPRLIVERFASVGWLGAEDADWLCDWFDRLFPWRPEQPELVLIHGDFAPQNLMVDVAVVSNANDDPDRIRLSGIVDWGDAAWADPATDFAKLRLADVHTALIGYLEAAEPNSEQFFTWSARILWHHLAWAIARLEDPVPRPRARHWTAPPSSRLFHLARFFLNNPPEPWRSLAPPR